jgi:hypothetical protein
VWGVKLATSSAVVDRKVVHQIRTRNLMRIVVAGGHGQIAMLLHPLLKARGHHV